MHRLAAATIALVFLVAVPAAGQGTLVRVEASTVGVASNAADANRQVLLRIIPEVQSGVRLNDRWTLDASLAGTASTSGRYLFSSKVSGETDTSLHRAWVRLASPHLEVRAGLQKISFGSSSLFRPLMWFDRVDARDPTQFSEGVYGLLARYVSSGNHSLWAWGLYGNDDARGWDSWGTESRKPEFGGRAQLALNRGEIGATYHHRRAWVAASVPQGASLAPASTAASMPAAAPEDRIGLDAKFDVGPGVWFEAVYVRTDTDLVRRRWEPSVSLGMDYTFGAGNGLTLLAEHFILEPSVPRVAASSRVKLSAVTASYPLGPADSLAGVMYYEWSREDLFRFVEWRRTWDHWRLHVIGFWNPTRPSVFAVRGQTSALTGRGVELAVVASY
jgi:hypothetical protein